jgi:hypothetical protein
MNIKDLNKDIEVYSVYEPEFARFGRVLYGFDTTEIIEAAKSKEMPEEGSVYEASTEIFENLPIAGEIAYKCFGEMPTQIGYCYGHSNFLNGLEWHTSSEINIATTDLVLILGDVRDLVDNKIDSSKTIAFFVKKGTIIEVYATTLHFCPCEVKKSGFGSVVALPKGTNLPLETESDDKLLFRKNKWIIAHNDNEGLIARGVKKGISGKNIEIKY